MHTNLVPVFDIGNVLIRADFTPLFDRFAYSDAARREFLATVMTTDFLREQDLGRDWRSGVDMLVAAHPAHAPLLRHVRDNWLDCITGPIAGTVAIMQALRTAGFPVYALSNLCSTRYQWLCDRDTYRFFHNMQGVLLSEEAKRVKPDPEIYRFFCDKFNLLPQQIVFIDDNHDNVLAARKFGMQAFLFTTSEQLHEDLTVLGMLPKTSARVLTPRPQNKNTQ